jgi:hypothetical protein
MIGRHLAVLALSAALCACGGGEKNAGKPGVYKISVAEAYQRLNNSELPDFVYAWQCGILIHVRPEGVDDHTVTWHVRSSGEEMLTFTVTLTPVSPTETRFDLAVSPAAEGKEAYDGSHFYVRPALRQPIRSAVSEQVAALLEGRKFDVMRVVQGPRDQVCNAQRGGLESGMHFSIHDKPGMDSSAGRNGRR